MCVPHPQLLRILAAASFLLAGGGASANPGYPHREAPRLLNYYLRTDIAGKEILLSKWDVLVLPFQLIDWAPASLTLIRQSNPELMLLAYIDPVLITDNLGPDDTPGTLRHDFVSGVHSEWLARNEMGQVISFWEHAEHVNITAVCPTVNGERFRDYFIRFVRERFFPLIETGVIDGVFLDEMSNGGYLWWDPLFAGSFDYNNNQIADLYEAGIGSAGIQAWLTESMAMFADSLAAQLPPSTVIMGNNSKPRHDALHGKLYEAFPGSPGEGYFDGTLMDLDIWNSLEFGTNLTSVNGLYPFQEVGGSPFDMPPFRFRYTGSLLSDNYFSYDFSTFDHYQVTWYDLFDFQLGLPLGPRFTLNETPLFVDVFEGGIGPHVAPFAPHTAVSITSEPGLVLQGASSLLATTNAADPFPTLFYVTPTGGFLPDTSYVFSFRYRMLDVALGETQLFFKSAPGGLTTTTLRAEAGAEGLYRGKLNLGSATNYTVRLVTRGIVSMVIDSLSVVLGDGGLLAREYENGLVVCNASEADQVLAYDADWTLLPGDDQAADFAPWLGGSAITVPYEDGVVFARGETASDELPAGMRSQIALGPPYPNPGNPGMTLHLSGAPGLNVRLTLHDVQGRELAELWAGVPGPDGRLLVFSSGDGSLPQLASGVYLLRAAGGGTQQARRWLLLR
ncbi:hypothetical protein FJ251_00575 [bacterium]|nr:hypothetical protein [bacterium]